MASRPHVELVEAELRHRIETGADRPGERFATARQLAASRGISYQTAHRLLRRLVEDGLITRRQGSGTYVAGNAWRPDSVRVILSRRAKRVSSFGGKLQSSLRETFASATLDYSFSYDVAEALSGPVLPILWETPRLLDQCIASRRPAILINDRPPPSLGGHHLDAVCADDFAGGALAADVLRRSRSGHARLVVLGGPESDRRSSDRIAGFRSRARAREVHAADWFAESGEKAAAQVLDARPQGVFAANDRLAEGFLTACRSRGITPPAVIGYDDAPIAEPLGLTTIALPWRDLATAIADRARARLSEPDSAACTSLLQPRVIVRASTV